MFEYAWVRFLVTALLFAAYSVTDMLSRWIAREKRPPRVRRPRWSHFIGFASVLFLYEAIVRDGRAIHGGAGNQLGVLLALVAILLRFATSRGTQAVRYPDLAARLLFYASLPIVIGSPRSFVLFTLAQAAIAIKEALQRDEFHGAAADSAHLNEAATHRLIPGVW